jgi:serpin B
MRKINVLGLLSVIGALACGNGDRPPATDPSATDPSSTDPSSTRAPAARGGGGPALSEDLAAAQNALAVDLYQELRTRDGNLALSPTSISLALAMTMAGARGETAEAMARTLHLEGVEDPHAAYAARLAAINDTSRTAYELRTANRLFGERTVGFRSEYVQLTADRYGAPLEPLDFTNDADGSRGQINSWVERETNARIRGLLPPGSISNGTRLVLTNAIYFHGRWRTEFEREQTRSRGFRLADGGVVEVPTMHQHASLRYGTNETMSLLELPYVGDELSMVLILPNAADGFPALEQALDAQQLAEWIGAMHEREVDVALPRFTIDPPASIELSSVLSNLGMGVAFGSGADFSGMSETPLNISEVFHKPFVQVNEQGTEAAAATAVPMVESASLNPSFEALHPFLFVIRDRRDGSILFLGRVADPRL